MIWYSSSYFTETPMGQLPILEVSDIGMKTPMVLHETHSILRYLAREFGKLANDVLLCKIVNNIDLNWIDEYRLINPFELLRRFKVRAEFRSGQISITDSLFSPSPFYKNVMGKRQDGSLCGLYVWSTLIRRFRWAYQFESRSMLHRVFHVFFGQ